MLPRKIGVLRDFCFGPLVWFGQLSGLYMAATLACLPTAPIAFAPVAIALTAIAVVAVTASLLSTKALLASADGVERRPFRISVRVTSDALSLIAIAWLGLAAASLSSCR